MIPWIVILAASLPGQEAASTKVDENLAHMKSVAASYRLALDGDRSGPPVLGPEPTFRMGKQAADDVLDGALFFWSSDGGRPEAVAQLFRVKDRDASGGHWVLEFISLSPGTFTSDRAGKPGWAPRKPGVAFRPMPDTPKAGATAAQRARHVRPLAGEFQVSDHFKEAGWSDLRLLPTPAARSGRAGSGVLDGFLFAFALGTDPEALVFLEAREGPEGPAWHYALAPMSCFALRGSLKGKVVREVPDKKDAYDPSQPYFVRLDRTPTSNPGPAMETAKNADSPGPSNEDAAIVARLRDARMRVKEEMAKVVVGQESVIDRLLVALLCRGHVLLLGVPGVGKTLMGRTLARTLDLDFRRIQFTPDLMPSDITGMDIIEEDAATGRRKLEFLPGPVFANFLLADEINRTPPKTQSALLQAMQENEVTIGRRTYPLKPPFFVVATRNPIEMEGTYPLPEAQLDRFMFNVKVKYPTVAEEIRVVKGTTGTQSAQAHAILKADELLRLQDLVRGVPVADSVVSYAVRLVAASRPGEAKAIEGVHKYLLYGASPRASQYLVLGAKARAILAGKYHVDFEDVKAQAGPVLRHRLVLNFHARADGVDADAIVRRLLESVRQEG